MSKLYVSLDLKSKKWGVALQGPPSKFVDVLFGFIRKPKSGPTEFNDLSFGVIVQKDGEIIYYNSYPKPGIQYKSTTSDIIEMYRIDNLTKNSKYDMLFWVINDGVKSEHRYTLVTPNTEELTDYEVE